jgi:hypothetical protein
MENNTEKQESVGTYEDWEEKICESVMCEWEKGTQYCDQMNNLYEDIYAMIRGERPEKNYDWQSNIVINKVFQTIWTAIPYITMKIFGANPIVGVKSFDKKGAAQREAILEFWNNLETTADKKHTTYFLVMVMWLLRSLLNGVGIVKKGWHQKLKTITHNLVNDVPTGVDEEGNVTGYEKVNQTIKNTIPIEDWPVNIVCNNRDVVVDWMLKPGQSIRQGRFVIHRSLEDLDYLKKSDIKYMNLEKVGLSSTESSEITQDHSPMLGRDGLDTPPQQDMYADVELYERVGKYPVYKDKLEGRWVGAYGDDVTSEDVVYKDMIITVAIEDGKKKHLVRFDENPYGLINYIDMHIYFDEERWHSMGMVEPFKDLQTALNDNINAVFDKTWQELMPPVVINKFALWDYDTMEYAPRQRWLVGGNPSESILPLTGQRVTMDAWQNHQLFDTEIQLTSAITPPMQGGAKEKAATTNVMNAQFSAGKLDFLIKMIEKTGLIPSAQMDVMFAKKFAHRATFKFILGEDFSYSDFEEIYKYIPAASSVKLEYQKETEIQQDIQLIQIFSSVQNPNVPKILNVLWSNILRNREMPKEAAMFDEEYFSPDSDAGNIQMLKRLSGRVPSNQNQIAMSGAEQNIRNRTYSPAGMANG